MKYGSKQYLFSRYLKPFFLISALLIVGISMYFSNRLANSLAEEEKKKIEIWAEATRQFILSESPSEIDFLWRIIEENSTIPVLIVDESNELISSRNFREPKKNTEAFYRKNIERLREKGSVITIQLSDTRQYIYYDDSLLLRQLYYFPYWQLGVIFFFMLIVLLAFSSSKRAEQNRVWVGLSKETAHQLGTPISSLLAWVDLLKLRYPDEKLIDEMSKDVNRLRIIAERFSKIGSAPDLSLVSLNETLGNALHYIAQRSSQQVAIHYEAQEDDTFLYLNVPLFEWVIENLCKNAIDAMDGAGNIYIEVHKLKDKEVAIDIKDTGKGLDRSHFKTIFLPGYTTKSRGWGLGLSLAKRIIEKYHQGKIFVKQSEPKIGSTFRIILKEVR